MLRIGCHLSLAGGYEEMGRTALTIGANTFAYFTRNPRGGGTRTPDPEDVAALRALLEENAFAPLVAHAPYTLNLCSDKPHVCAYAEETMREDLSALEALPGNYYNFHPGCHMRQGSETGIQMISDALNRIMQADMHTVMLLETMAGKGSEVGGRFEEIRAILDRLTLPEKFGVCLDTCHVSDAGYDLVNRLDDVLDEFDRVIGRSRLRAIHLNDSKNPPGSHKDRHEKIGQGTIGLEAIVRIISHPVLKELPFILETPNELDGYAGEIRLLRTMIAELNGQKVDHESGKSEPLSGKGLCGSSARTS